MTTVPHSTIAAQTAVNIAIRAAHDEAMWGAIFANEAHQRRVGLATLLADRHVGDLPDFVVAALGLTTNARRVMVTYGTIQHIVGRRKPTLKDVELCAERLSEALRNLKNHLAPNIVAPSYTVFHLIAYVPSEGLDVILPLKFVPAKDATKHDEWWIRTSIPFGRMKMMNALKRGRLKPLST